jgi:hypothetical protein
MHAMRMPFVKSNLCPAKAAAACLLLAAASGGSIAAPTAPTAPDEPVLHYVRTNDDGTEPEKIVIHRAAGGKVEVFKEQSPCTNAAYVTAQLDQDGQTRSLVGGRLTRELTQQPFAWLEDTGGRLAVRLAPDAAPVVVEAKVAPRWVMFDFDFSDLIAAPPPAIRAGKALSFDLPLIRPRDDGMSLDNLGRLVLEPEQVETVNGMAVRRYRASGAALGDKHGFIWFRVSDGLLADARLPIPNHAEYRDFRLRLQKEEHGAQAWRAALANHWMGCPRAAEK